MWSRFLKRTKRQLVEVMMRDPRMRRVAVAHAFAKYLHPNALCLVPFQDHALFVNPADDRIAATLLQGKPWQRDAFTAAITLIDHHKRLPPGGTFVDIGANIGAMTVYALLSGHFATALAVEPDPTNFALLQKNIAHNGLEDRVQLINCALSDTSGQAKLFRDKHNLGAHSLEENFAKSPGTALDVDVVSFDALLTQTTTSADTIGLIKIDVEGHERAVLRGMANALSSTPPVILEATFSPAHPEKDAAALQALFPLSYRHYVDLDNPVSQPPQDAQSEARQPPPAHFMTSEVANWCDFVPNAHQHELAIF